MLTRFRLGLALHGAVFPAIAVGIAAALAGGPADRRGLIGFVVLAGAFLLVVGVASARGPRALLATYREHAPDDELEPVFREVVFAAGVTVLAGVVLLLLGAPP